MKLTNFGIVVATNRAVLNVGKAEATGIFDSENNEYFKVPLLNPINVACSTDSEVGLIPTDYVLVRAADIEGDAWEPANKEKFEELEKAGKGNEYAEGFIIPDFVCDFSKNRKEVLYQEATIASWRKKTREGEKEIRNNDLRAAIQAKKAAMGIK